MKHCSYCKKEVSKLGISAHERYCQANPNRLTKGLGGRKKGTTPWNKGIKTGKNPKISQALTGKSNGRALTPESEELRRNKISESMKANPLAGGLRIGSGRGIKGWYDSSIAGSVYLRSSYEFRVAEYFDSKNINWRANTEAFNYMFNGEAHKYYPDFYLIDLDCYVEVKGFKTKKDQAKWENFPNKLVVLYENDIRHLEIGGSNPSLSAKASRLMID
jgi:hypothetical protein